MQDVKNSDSKELFKALSESEKPVCCVSSRPDYDGFCSALAMREVFANEFGTDLRLVYFNPVPEDMKLVIDKYADVSAIEENIDIESFDFSDYDLLLYTDTSDKGNIADEVIKDFEIPEHMVSVNIDHHVGQNDFFADLNLVEKASSTCVILYELFQEMNVEITPTIASLLLLGALDDSLIFQVDEVRPKDLVIVSRLVEAVPGRNLFDFVYSLTYNKSRTELMYYRMTFEHLVIDEGKACAYSYITLADMEKNGVDPRQKPSTSPIEMLRKTRGVKFAFLLKQKQDDPRSYSLSLRARDKGFDVARIARALGGGGHKMAAGGLIVDVDSPEEAERKVFEKVREIYPEL